MSVVYFVQAGAGGPIKIGIASNIRSRLSGLQTSSPDPLVLLATIEGGRREERALHSYLGSDRHRGEWFKPTDLVLGIVEDAKAGALDCSRFPRRHSHIIVGAGYIRVASVCGVPENTVRSWITRDRIPGQYWQPIVKAGFSTVPDLLEAVTPRKRPDRKAA